MNTPGSILLGAVILAATYAALNVYEVRTHDRSLWRINRITGEIAFCTRRECNYVQKWRKVSARAAVRKQQPRSFTFEEAFGKSALPDESAPEEE